ncbi:MAG: ribonuclease HII [Bacteroidales bacterium]|nr:ribonuclease HII [Bacteroidales bacterium]
MLKSCFQYGVLEAGCDEAGRGCLAGPVFAAAVVLPSDYRHDELNDSKQLSAGKRERLRLDIERDALAWAVARVDAPEIDRINILQASIRAMNLAVEGLSLRPELLLIDGNRFHTASGIPFRCVVKGDATYLSIAAASVLAKTYRDSFMLKLDELYPEYQWKKNKGYPTREHREAIRRYGATPYHRKSFTLINNQLSFSF